jgi:hypothetical protein
VIDVRRGLLVLAGVAAGGALVWTASQRDPTTTEGYWASVALLAAAGIALMVFWLLSTWRRNDRPLFDVASFLIGFMPTLIVAGWVVVSDQPNGNWFRSHVLAWSNDLGIGGVLEDLQSYGAVLAFATGLVFAFSAIHTRRSVTPVAVETEGARAADEPTVEDSSARLHERAA